MLLSPSGMQMQVQAVVPEGQIMLVQLPPSLPNPMQPMMPQLPHGSAATSLVQMQQQPIQAPRAVVQATPAPVPRQVRAAQTRLAEAAAPSAPPLTAEEALQAAAAEGLTLQ